MKKIFIIMMVLFTMLVSVSYAHEVSYKFEQVDSFNTVVVNVPAKFSVVEDSSYVVRMRTENYSNYRIENDTLFIESINHVWDDQNEDPNKTRFVLRHPDPSKLLKSIKCGRKSLIISKNKSGNQN